MFCDVRTISADLASLDCAGAGHIVASERTVSRLWLSLSLPVHLPLQGFLDIDLTDLRKGGANITGFQLVNNSEPSVSRVVQQWMEFDNKDSKMAKKGLKVTVMFTFAHRP